MFNKAAFLAVTIAVSTAASPTPVPSVARGNIGTPIPLRKRSGFTQANGVFDKDKAIVATVGTINKHRSNLLNLVQNLGIEALHIGAIIKPLEKIPPLVQSRMERRAEKRQAEALTGLENDLEWAGTVSIGSPPQDFLIDFDTGSADLWVPSSACNSSTCSPKSKYMASASSTSSKKSGSFSILYGDGSTVNGPVYTDTVDVAGIKAKAQYFSPVTTLSSSFENDPIDGILGLAFPAISNLNQSPFFNTANKDGTVKSNQFGFFLASNDSELYLGGTNPDRFSGDVEYHDVDSSTGFWQIPNASIKVGGSTAADSFETIIDSGTTIMYGPPAVVKEVYAQVNGSALFDSGNGFYSFPCKSPPEMAFNWGGSDWTISAKNINLGTTEEGSDLCVGALAGQDLGLGNDVWLLGDSFMKSAYSVFDFDREAVGFAALA